MLLATRSRLCTRVGWSRKWRRKIWRSRLRKRRRWKLPEQRTNRNHRQEGWTHPHLQPEKSWCHTSNENIVVIEVHFDSLYMFQRLSPDEVLIADKFRIATFYKSKIFTVSWASVISVDGSWSPMSASGWSSFSSSSMRNKLSRRWREPFRLPPLIWVLYLCKWHCEVN